MSKKSLRKILICPGTAPQSFDAYIAIGSEIKSRGIQVVFLAETDALEVKIAKHNFVTVKFQTTWLDQLLKILCVIYILGRLVSPLSLLQSRTKAKKLVNENDFSAAIICSDTRLGPEFWIAKMVPSVVPQITFDSCGVKALKKTINFKPFPRKFIHMCFGFLIPKKCLPKLGGEPTLAWDNLRRTLLLCLLKQTIACPRKGGGGAKKICVNGQAFVRVFKEYGIDPKKIVVTGSPEHDLFQVFAQKYSVDDSKCKLNLKGKSIAIFLQPFLGRWGKNYIAEIESIVKKITKTSLDNIVLKVHPKDDIAVYQPLTQISSKVLILDRPGLEFNGHIINSSECVVMRSSTVGFQAVAMGIPLITYNLETEQTTEFGDYFFAINKSFHANSLNQLVDLIHKTLNPSAKKQICQKQLQEVGAYITTDGQACKRIADAVLSLTS